MAARPARSGKNAEPAISHDPNRLNHIFEKAKHHRAHVVQKFGSQHAAFEGIQNAIQAAAGAVRISGVFETVVRAGGFDIAVRGRGIDGVVRIGTALIP